MSTPSLSISAYMSYYMMHVEHVFYLITSFKIDPIY